MVPKPQDQPVQESHTTTQILVNADGFNTTVNTVIDDTNQSFRGQANASITRKFVERREQVMKNLTFSDTKTDFTGSADQKPPNDKIVKTIRSRQSVDQIDPVPSNEIKEAENQNDERPSNKISSLNKTVLSSHNLPNVDFMGINGDKNESYKLSDDELKEMAIQLNPIDEDQMEIDELVEKTPVKKAGEGKTSHKRILFSASKEPNFNESKDSQVSLITSIMPLGVLPDPRIPIVSKRNKLFYGHFDFFLMFCSSRFILISFFYRSSEIDISATKLGR